MVRRHPAIGRLTLLWKALAVAVRKSYVPELYVDLSGVRRCGKVFSLGQGYCSLELPVAATGTRVGSAANYFQ
jgi:hypothetical protein